MFAKFKCSGLILCQDKPMYSGPIGNIKAKMLSDSGGFTPLTADKGLLLDPVGGTESVLLTGFILCTSVPMCVTV